MAVSCDLCFESWTAMVRGEKTMRTKTTLAAILVALFVLVTKFRSGGKAPSSDENETSSQTTPA